MISGTTGFLFCVYMQLKELPGGGGGGRTLIWDVSEWWTGHLGFRCSLSPNWLPRQVSLWTRWPLGPFSQPFCWSIWTAGYPAVFLNPSPLWGLWLRSLFSSSPTALSPLLLLPLPSSTLPSPALLALFFLSPLKCVFQDSDLSPRLLSLSKRSLGNSSFLGVLMTPRCLVFIHLISIN